MLTAFTAGLLLITVSELGDKTFFIAVILAMRHPRHLVLIGVTVALATMTLLSVAIGEVMTFLPRIYTHYAAISLFLFFGVKLLYEASQMTALATDEVIIAAKKTVDVGEQYLHDHNTNRAVLWESFVLTFLAEWGDRTQIATITLAAAHNVVGVTLGAILGHTVCAMIAVLGGGLIAGRVSERAITAIGGCLFLVFATVAIWEGASVA